MPKLKAVCLVTFGGPEALYVNEIDIPVLVDDEVLIQFEPRAPIQRL